MTPAAPGRSPWDRYGWLMGAIWLVFLVFPVAAILDQRPGTTELVTALGAIALFAAVYVDGLVRAEHEASDDALRWRVAARLVVMGALVAVVLVAVGEESFGMLPYVVALSMLTIPLPVALAVAVGCIALPPWWTGGEWYLSLVVALVAAATGIVRVLDERGVNHDRITRELEIVTERDRVARDVHDVLGHSLTVVAAKAQLADRLVDVDPQRAHQELAQIQSLTREALAEIRATVAGLRVARLGDELAAARAALSAAGIDPEVPTDVDVVDPRHRIVLAWVLREAVTNVVRHSGATRCRVTLSRNGLSVTDDGAGTRGAAEGNGLRGMRERVTAAGGTMSVGPGAHGRGTTLEVVL